MIEGLKNLYVAVCDFDRSVAFYRDLLGLKQLDLFQAEDGHRGCILKAGEVTMILAEPHSDYSDKRPWQTMLNIEKLELGFRVEDVDRFYQAMVDKGAPIVHGPENTHWGVRRFTLKDPDGIPVEIYQELP